MFRYILTTPSEAIRLDPRILDRIAEDVSHVCPCVARGVVEMTFAPDEDVRALNLHHRSIDRTTDVLSFAYYPDFG